jgi:hypothetical protein
MTCHVALSAAHTLSHILYTRVPHTSHATVAAAAALIRLPAVHQRVERYLQDLA